MPNTNELNTTTCNKCHCNPCECAEIEREVNEAVEKDGRREHRHH